MLGQTLTPAGTHLASRTRTSTSPRRTRWPPRRSFWTGTCRGLPDTTPSTSSTRTSARPSGRPDEEGRKVRFRKWRTTTENRAWPASKKARTTSTNAMSSPTSPNKLGPPCWPNARPPDAGPGRCRCRRRRRRTPTTPCRRRRLPCRRPTRTSAVPVLAPPSPRQELSDLRHLQTQQVETRRPTILTFVDRQQFVVSMTEMDIACMKAEGKHGTCHPNPSKDYEP